MLSGVMYVTGTCWAQSALCREMQLMCLNACLAEILQYFTVPLQPDILSRMSLQASVKAARGSSNGGSCLRNLRHEYVTCDIPSTALGSTACLRESTVSGQVIVDPTFRDSFEISVMTPVYRKLLEQIPDVLVAAPHRLPLVSALGMCGLGHEKSQDHLRHFGHYKNIWLRCCPG